MTWAHDTSKGAIGGGGGEHPLDGPHPTDLAA